MMLWKCCTQYASKFGKLSSGHRTGKGQVSFQSQRKAMPKNVQTRFRKGRGPEIKLPTSVGSSKKQESSRKTSTSALLITSNLWLCGSQQTGKFFKRWENQTIWPASWEICMQVRKQQLELDMDSSHSDWHEMVPHWGFDLHFSDKEWCWASFHVFVFFGEMCLVVWLTF